MRKTVAIQRAWYRATSGVKAVMFPDVCICCGTEVTTGDRMICSFCLSERFEVADPQNRISSSNTLLPEGVLVQLALWQFDSGGVLRDLLHQLKYDRLSDIGVQLGLQLGRRMERHPIMTELLGSREAILLPVPLHFLKRMRRGFNQAYYIARGIREVWDLPICDIRAVVRTRNTRSQTGFDLRKRMENMKGAFRVNEPEAVSGKVAVVVDDVFTTGSTAFELSGELLKAGADGIAVATVAQA